VTGEKWAVRWVDGWCHIKLNRVEIILIMNLDNSAEANWAVSSKRALNSQSTKLAYTYIAVATAHRKNLKLGEKQKGAGNEGKTSRLVGDPELSN